MKLLPFDAFRFRTRLHLDVAMRRLRESAEPRKWFRGAGRHEYFEGEVTSNSFRLQRILSGPDELAGKTNAFLPVVSGEISSDGAGALVRVRMHPPLFTVVLVVPILIMLVSVAIGAERGPLALFAAAFIVWAVAQLAFWSEASAQKSLLEALLEAEEQAPAKSGTAR